MDASGATHLEKICLEVGAHRGSGYADHEGGKWVEAARVAGRFRDIVAVSARGVQGGGGHRRKPTPQATRFETHPDQTREPKHDGDADMLDLLVGVRVARVRAETLHPRIGDAVEEYHKGLDKFRGDVLAGWRAVPRPAKLGKRSKEPGKTSKTVAPEDASLCMAKDKMSQGACRKSEKLDICSLITWARHPFK